MTYQHPRWLSHAVVALSFDVNNKTRGSATRTFSYNAKRRNWHFAWSCSSDYSFAFSRSWHDKSYTWSVCNPVKFWRVDIRLAVELRWVLPDDYLVIATIPWFSRTTVLACTEKDFEHLELYAWDGQFFWSVESEALGSRIWCEIIAVDGSDLNFHSSADARKSRHLANVAKGMLSLTGGLLVEEDFDVDIWSYRYYAERPYVSNLWAQPAEQLALWRGWYMMHPDAVCWERAIFPSRSQYLDRPKSVYCSQQVRWEWRTLSALGWFVPYHMCCCYNLREKSHDRLLVRIPPFFVRLKVCHGFRFEQETIFI